MAPRNTYYFNACVWFLELKNRKNYHSSIFMMRGWNNFWLRSKVLSHNNWGTCHLDVDIWHCHLGSVLEEWSKVWNDHLSACLSIFLLIIYQVSLKLSSGWIVNTAFSTTDLNYHPLLPLHINSCILKIIDSFQRNVSKIMWILHIHFIIGTFFCLFWRIQSIFQNSKPLLSRSHRFFSPKIDWGLEVTEKTRS